MTVPSPERAKQAKWLFHLFLCSCSYGHSAGTHSPCCPSLRMWRVTSQVAAPSVLQRTGTASAGQLLFLTAPFSLALHHLSSAGHRAQLQHEDSNRLSQWPRSAVSPGDGSATGTALPSQQCTQGHLVTAHAPLLAVNTSGEYLLVVQPQKTGKI